jgi:hypothetical protein
MFESVKMANVWNNSQTQTIDPAFLPQLTDNKKLSKKDDLAISFSPEHPEVKALYNAFRREFRDYDLSPLLDAYTSRLLVTYAFEAKRYDGEEAHIQLAVFHAAILMKLANILSTNKPVRYSDVPPMLGWTMVGPRWSFFITSIQDDASIVGPMTVPSLDPSHN